VTPIESDATQARRQFLPNIQIKSDTDTEWSIQGEILCGCLFIINLFAFPFHAAAFPNPANYGYIYTKSVRRIFQSKLKLKPMVFFAVIGGAALVQPAKHFRLPCQSVTAFVCDRCDFQSAETIPGSRKKTHRCFWRGSDSMQNRYADYGGPILSCCLNWD